MVALYRPGGMSELSRAEDLRALTHFMVWSLNKDDDGIEGVTVAGQTVVEGFAYATPQRSEFPSIVVDPESQIPEPLHGARRPGKQALEATEVLKGRRLDDLRAEVRRRRAAHRRKKLFALAIWAVAGASALAAGAFVASSLLSGAQAEDSTSGVESSSADGALAQVPTPLVEDPRPAPSDAMRPAKREAPSRAIHDDEREEATPSGEDEAFTLDDLPAE